MKTIILLLALALVFLGSTAYAQVFKWTDEKGVVCFTEDWEQIPEKYRDQAKRREMPENSNAREGERSGSFNPTDLIDNTKKYVGRTLKMSLIIGSAIFGDRGQSLQNFTGSYVDFRNSYGNSRLDIRVYIPKSLSVPKASYGDNLLVTFICRDGDLRNGNEAISITRP